MNSFQLQEKSYAPQYHYDNADEELKNDLVGCSTKFCVHVFIDTFDVGEEVEYYAKTMTEIEDVPSASSITPQYHFFQLSTSATDQYMAQQMIKDK